MYERNAFRTNQICLGVCYYPEQWAESLWAEDFWRMREMGLTVVRMAEFGWALIEPSEGQFSFALFDRAVDLAHAHGLQVILGTPTAAPPAWLTQRYPEVLNVSYEGVQYQHGLRRHCNYNAQIYRDLCARVTKKLVEHYCDHPAVIGWQIDNEFNCESNVFYADADHRAFRTWLQGKHGTLEALNAAWGATFWSQTYSAWGQVYLPRPNPKNSPNPHQALDEKRFISETVIEFARLQAGIIRRYAPHQWITTNGLFKHIDYQRLTDECLSFLSYDSYPAFGIIYPEQTANPLRDRRWSWGLSAVRSISPMFGVMEQQSGPGGWVTDFPQPAPHPGQMRLWTYQSIAHGADMVLFFRWRTACVGTEMYWHGINDHHNQPTRRTREVAQIGAEVAQIGAAIAGTRVRAEVALLSSYDNDWDGEVDVWHGPLTRTSTQAWVEVLQRQHIPTDMVLVRHATTLAELSQYRMLVWPHAPILSDATAELLRAYVAAGGVLVVGCRTGYKNEYGHCRMAPLPGPLTELCGAIVAEYSYIGTHQKAPVVHGPCLSATNTITADSFNEMLQTVSPQAEVLATYATGDYAGQAALVRHHYEQGATLYYGAVFTPFLVMELLHLLDIPSPTARWLTLPVDVELCVRQHPETGTQYIFLLNYSDAPQVITFGRSVINVLLGKVINGTVELDPYDVLICSVGNSAKNEEVVY